MTLQWRWLLVLAALLAATLAHAESRAVLIGVGQYATKRIERLEGPAEDVRAVRERLIGKLGFAPSAVTTLLDAQATRAGILAALGQLEGQTKAGDFILIYFSGHGSSYKDAGGFGAVAHLPYASGAWLPYDTELDIKKDVAGSIIIGRRDLRPILEALDRGGRRVLVISDSCFSGQLVRGTSRKSGLKFVALPGAVDPLEAASELGNRHDPPPYPYHHVSMLSASNENEPAHDINTETLASWPTIDNKPHGALTDALLRVFDGQLGASVDSDGHASLAALHRAIDNFMNSRNYGQAPQMLPSIREDKDGLLTSPLPGLKAAPIRQTGGADVSIELASNNAALRDQLTGLGGVKLTRRAADFTVSGDLSHLRLVDKAGDTVNETGDVNALLTRIRAESWLRGKLPVAGGRFDLLAELDPNTRGGNYLRCETLAVNVRAGAPVWLLVLDVDSSGTFTTLYPNNRAEIRQLAANEVTVIPGLRPQDRIQVTPPFGIDHLYVFAFNRKPDFLDALAGQRFGAGQPLAEQFAAGLNKETANLQYQKLVLRTSANPALGDGPCPKNP
ncbi:caspase family protein [Andreprevotia chitinilytica]|uniref:caspase family protein n=1 Tax=Andreprevotia chitinilytica TaxID=396808 RepID=UPI00054E8385|nr:caspase family protein [Andreprevotia chitinilytica]